MRVHPFFDEVWQFNQSQGISSGFGHEDEYNVYSKPMVDRGKASVYRPKAEDGAFADADKDYEELKSDQAKRFKADKQFRGTEQVAAARGARNGPVQFSYDNVKEEEEEEEKESRRDGDRRSRSKDRGVERRRSPSRSPSRSRGRDRRRSPSRTPPPARGRSDSRHSRSRSRSPARSRSRGHRRSLSRSPSRSRVRTRRRSPSHSPSRSRSRGRREPDRKRSRRNSSDDDSDDPFGLDQFLTDARKSGRGNDDDRRRR